MRKKELKKKKKFNECETYRNKSNISWVLKWAQFILRDDFAM